MLTCELTHAYAELLNGRIKDELNPSLKRNVKDTAWGILQSAIFCQCTNEITSEELEGIYKRIIEMCPEFEEGINEKLKDKFPQITLVNVGVLE
jgi:hypothetical protein